MNPRGADTRLSFVRKRAPLDALVLLGGATCDDWNEGGQKNNLVVVHPHHQLISIVSGGSRNVRMGGGAGVAQPSPAGVWGGRCKPPIGVRGRAL